ncbi:restriction endonuclease subunit S, partial [Akkermansiaceae bacterium]|nr:restriction endonuclease subunit S [Akkermansiaceae bacterium]
SEGKRTSLAENDILISITAELGKIGIVPSNFGTAYINQHTALVRLDFERADARFVAHKLSSKSMNNKINRLNDSGAKSGLNLPTIRSFPISVPTFPEQKKIADFLTSVDDRIGQLIKKKALLEDYKKGVMQQLFSQQIRFKDDNGNDFPDWEEKKLGDIGNLYQPKTISQTDLTSEGFTVYGANGIIGKYHSFNHEKSQVTVTCRGSTCGVIGYTEPHSWITGNAMVVNLDEHLDSTKTFVYHALCATDLRYLITGSGQPQITGNLKGHKIGYPTLPEQKKIADFLTSVDQKIESVSQQITKTQTFKKGLLQQMFV